MKTVFIEARSDVKIVLPKALIEKLPQKIGLITTVQHLDEIDSIKKQLKGKEVYTSKGIRCKHECQVLGCDSDAAISLKDKVDAYLYIGSGEFHPKFILIRLDVDKKVYVYNPFSDEYKTMDKKSIEKILKRRNGALAKFHSSENIGILVSTKPGQDRLKEAQEFKEKIRPKQGYILVSETLDFSELENFPFIDCFVNTMCERIGYDDTVRTPRPIVNIDDI